MCSRTARSSNPRRDLRAIPWRLLSLAYPHARSCPMSDDAVHELVLPLAQRNRVYFEPRAFLLSTLLRLSRRADTLRARGARSMSFMLPEPFSPSALAPYSRTTAGLSFAPLLTLDRCRRSSGRIPAARFLRLLVQRSRVALDRSEPRAAAASRARAHARAAPPRPRRARRRYMRSSCLHSRRPPSRAISMR